MYVFTIVACVVDDFPAVLPECRGGFRKTSSHDVGGPRLCEKIQGLLVRGLAEVVEDQQDAAGTTPTGGLLLSTRN